MHEVRGKKKKQHGDMWLKPEEKGSIMLHISEIFILGE